MAGRLWVLLVASLIFAPASGLETSALDVGLSLLHPEVEAGRATKQALMIELTPPAADRPHKPPNRDLIIVLDTSGSMQEDDKLQKAKQAISSIVESSLPTDQLHLITYSSGAKQRSGLHDDKEQLLKTLAGLVANGGTNMHAGLEEASARLRQISHKESLKRVFLFSDGLVNVGVQAPSALAQAAAELLERGASTNAFGIGRDHDRALMSALAETGRGSYFFIRGAAEMEKVVAVATEGFRGLFATTARVRLFPSKGVEVLDPLGQLEEGVEGSHQVLVGDLYTGERRRVLVELSVPDLPEGLIDILECEISYLLEPNRELQTSEKSVHVKVQPRGLALAPENPEVSVFQRLQMLLSQESLVEERLEAGALQEARDAEQELEDALGGLLQACDGMEVCSRVQNAYSRTVRSNTMLKSESESAEMQKHAYAFKRHLDKSSSPHQDEL